MLYSNVYKMLKIILFTWLIQRHKPHSAVLLIFCLWYVLLSNSTNFKLKAIFFSEKTGRGLVSSASIYLLILIFQSFNIHLIRSNQTLGNICQCCLSWRKKKFILIHHIASQTSWNMILHYEDWLKRKSQSYLTTTVFTES